MEVLIQYLGVLYKFKVILSSVLHARTRGRSKTSHYSVSRPEKLKYFFQLLAYFKEKNMLLFFFFDVAFLPYFLLFPCKCTKFLIKTGQMVFPRGSHACSQNLVLRMMYLAPLVKEYLKLGLTLKDTKRMFPGLKKVLHKVFECTVQRRSPEGRKGRKAGDFFKVMFENI